MCSQHAPSGAAAISACNIWFVTFKARTVWLLVGQLLACAPNWPLLAAISACNIWFVTFKTRTVWLLVGQLLACAPNWPLLARPKDCNIWRAVRGHTRFGCAHYAWHGVMRSGNLVQLLEGCPKLLPGTRPFHLAAQLDT